MVLDSQNMMKVLEDFPLQCREALELPRGETITKEFDKIVVIGMGGSAVGGDILKAYMSESNILVHVVRDYKMPGHVDEKSLVFSISYSGNTEETLSATQDALKRNSQVIGITSGGKLAGMVPRVVQIPSGYQPRAALGYLLFPMMGILHNSNVINLTNAELNEMLNIIKKKDEFKEKGDILAKKIRDKIPVIYASEQLAPAAYRFRTQMHENGKVPAFHNVFSEMNHNEINAVQGMDRNITAIFIKDIHDNERIQKRMRISMELMEERIEVEIVNTQGEFLLSRLFSAIYMGDWTSYYAALLKRVDPSPVEVIERLKKKLVE